MAAQIRPLVIDTRRGMAILNPAGMPVNLGKTLAEDNPEQGIPPIIYAARNVLPTVMGYTSHMDLAHICNNRYEDNALPALDLEVIQKNKIVDALVYQTPNGTRVTVALGEQGLWMQAGDPYRSGSTPLGYKDLSLWTPIGNVSYSDKYRRWSHCTIGDMIYIYMQGEPTVFILGDLASMQTQVGAGATMLYQNEDMFFALVKQTPTFLNMEGQLGIFKADNRLGFWDSDNSVAWSSAINRMDFKPDATTFAGITKFADVVGRITQVLGHGKGFVIYSTGSVVYCASLSGSQEKFGGRAILSSTGISYYTQVDSGSTDSEHYAFTKNGLIRIDNGVVEPVEEAVSQHLISNYQLVTVRVINSMYVCLSVAPYVNEFTPKYYSRLLVNTDGTPGWFKPVVIEPPPTFRDWLITTLTGASLPIQDKWPESEDLEEPEEPAPGLGEMKPIIPLFSGAAYTGQIGAFDQYLPTTMSWTNFQDLIAETTPIKASTRFPGRSYQVKDIEMAMNSTINTDNIDWGFSTDSHSDFPELARGGFEDATPEEFITKFSGALTRWQQDDNKIRDQLLTANVDRRWAQVGGYNTVTPGSDSCIPYPTLPVDTSWTEIPSLTKRVNNVPNRRVPSMSINVLDNGCEITIEATVADVELFASYQVADEPFKNCLDDPDSYMSGGMAAVNIKYDVRMIEGTERKIKIFRAIVKGWAIYYPQSGIYRKIARRVTNGTCVPNRNASFDVSEGMDIAGLPEPWKEDITSIWEPEIVIDSGNTPDYDPDWGQPVGADFGVLLPPIRPIYGAFQKGLLHPNDPIYTRSYILDTRLDKWGSLDVPHRVLFDYAPRNIPNGIEDTGFVEGMVLPFTAAVWPVLNNPSTVVPATQIDLYYAHYSKINNIPCRLSARGFYSYVKYGRVGLRRTGSSKITGLGLWLDGKDTNGFAGVILSPSYDGLRTVEWPSTWTSTYSEEESLSPHRWTMSFAGSGKMPVMAVGDWFTIKIQGEFSLTGLELYGKPEGKLRIRYNQLPIG